MSCISQSRKQDQRKDGAYPESHFEGDTLPPTLWSRLGFCLSICWDVSLCSSSALWGDAEPLYDDSLSRMRRLL